MDKVYRLIKNVKLILKQGKVEKIKRNQPTRKTLPLLKYKVMLSTNLFTFPNKYELNSIITLQLQINFTYPG